jgi:hypothetical protein
MKLPPDIEGVADHGERTSPSNRPGCHPPEDTRRFGPARGRAARAKHQRGTMPAWLLRVNCSTAFGGTVPQELAQPWS